MMRQFGPYLLWMHEKGILQGSDITLIDRNASPDEAAKALTDIAEWIKANPLAGRGQSGD